MNSMNSSTRKKTLIRLLACVAALGLVLSGCASGRSASIVEPAVGTSTVVPGDVTAEGDAVGDAWGKASGVNTTASDAEGTGSQLSIDQQIIVTGEMTLKVDDPKKTVDDVKKIVVDAKGKVSYSSLNSNEYDLSGVMTVRVQADRYDAVVADIANLGEITKQTMDAQDVGAEVADLDARIKALEASIARLTDLMKNAETTSDLIEAESELTERQSQLDGLNAQRAWYADQVSYSTLNLHIDTPTILTGGASGSVWEQSWDTFVRGLGGVLFFLVMLLPWLIVIVPVVLLLVWWCRRRKMRRAVAPPTPPLVSPAAAKPGGDAAPVSVQAVGLAPTPLDDPETVDEGVSCDQTDSESASASDNE